MTAKLGCIAIISGLSLACLVSATSLSPVALAAQAGANHALAGANAEGFLKFKNEAALQRFLKNHAAASRVHPALLWAQGSAQVLEKLSATESANNEGIVENSYVPNQKYFVPPSHNQESVPEQLPANLWGISKINSETAWAVTRGRPEVVVAVVDTGIDYGHRALASQMLVNLAEKNGLPGVDDDGNGYVDDVYGYDFIDKKSDPQDDEGHGSHVAGTIAGNSPSENFYGVAPEVKLLAVKTHNTDGEGSEEAVVKGILYAADRGASVINCSWGGAPEAAKYSQLLFDAISYANKKGALLVAAAGNDGQNNDGLENYPANYKLPNVLAVAATGKNDKLAFFSNYGVQKVHIAAPGVDIWSVDLGHDYTKLSGTSMATPHMSGAAAIVYSAFLKSGISPEQVRAKLVENAAKIDSLKGKVISGLADLSFIAKSAQK